MNLDAYMDDFGRDLKRVAASDGRGAASRASCPRRSRRWPSRSP